MFLHLFSTLSSFICPFFALLALAFCSLFSRPGLLPFGFSRGFLTSFSPTFAIALPPSSIIEDWFVWVVFAYPLNLLLDSPFFQNHCCPHFFPRETSRAPSPPPLLLPHRFLPSFFFFPRSSDPKPPSPSSLRVPTPPPPFCFPPISLFPYFFFFPSLRRPGSRFKRISLRVDCPEILFALLVRPGLFSLSCSFRNINLSLFFLALP